MVEIYLRLIGARIRADWQYRTSFFAFTISQFFAGFLDFAVILVIFSNVHLLGGWTPVEVALLFGLTGTAFSIADVFVSQVEWLSFYIRQGTFDQFLIKPLGALVQMSAQQFALRRVGRIGQGVAVLAFAVIRLNLLGRVDKLAVIAVAVASGTLIFGGIWVITRSVGFWLIDAEEVANTFTYGGNYLSQYPLEIFSGWLRRAAVIVPLAFVNYFPAVWLLGRPDRIGAPGWFRFASPAVALVTVAVAAIVWRTGVRHYRSTGS